MYRRRGFRYQMESAHYGKKEQYKKKINEKSEKRIYENEPRLKSMTTARDQRNKN